MVADHSSGEQKSGVKRLYLVALVVGLCNSERDYQVPTLATYALLTAVVLSGPAAKGKKAKAPIKRQPAVVTGKVLDHNGKPMQGVKVSGRGNRYIGGEVTTDAAGRFRLPKVKVAYEKVVFTSKRLRFWAIRLGKSNSVTVKLPVAGTIKVRFHIPGANHPGEYRMQLNAKIPRIEKVGKKSVIRVRFKEFLNKEWGYLGPKAMQQLVDNPGEITFTGLAPGKYDLSRPKYMKLGGFSIGSFFNRQEVEVKPGKTTVVKLEVKKGRRIIGLVKGIPKGAKGAVIYIRDPQASPSPRAFDYKVTSYDGIGAGSDGKFVSASLKPGKYRINVHAYFPDPSKIFRSGIVLPSHTASKVITIPPGDKPLKVVITLKKRKK